MRELYSKYFELLNIKPEQPSLNFLQKILESHLKRIPFENVSKLLYKKQGMKTIPSLEEFLYGIENYNFGGTCYSINYRLYQLLKYAGFEAKLCGADMKNPDVHLIVMVNLNGYEYIADCGYAAPFMMPLPRNNTEDFLIKHGNEKFIVKPADESGRTRVEQYFNNRLQHWYIAKPAPRKIEEFNNVIEDSYSDDAVFMNALRITKYTDNGALVLKNFSFTENVEEEIVLTIIPHEEIPSAVCKKFGIPEPLIHEALAMIKELKEIYD